ncbi:uncharacterized protein LOC143845142 [Paroedura picta]|uniref:uncharacterized protein LOC143845142 n=1 Tax=Paroedura picta TaxID=143630 RepID=UPI004056D930
MAAFLRLVSNDDWLAGFPARLAQGSGRKGEMQLPRKSVDSKKNMNMCCLCVMGDLDGAQQCKAQMMAVGRVIDKERGLPEHIKEVTVTWSTEHPAGKITLRHSMVQWLRATACNLENQSCLKGCVQILEQYLLQRCLWASEH